MKIAIVGGAGYIGTALVSRLMKDSKHEVTVIDSLYFSGHALHSFLPYSDRFTFVRADVRSLDYSSLDDVDAVVNLAALNLPLSKQFPDEAMEVNHIAAVNLAKATKGKQYIFASTCSNYGVKSDGYAVETDELYPTSVYAKTKVETEKALGDNTTILRFATAYGLAARFRQDLLLHEFIRDAYTKKLITLQGPAFYRPLCHVDDIARAIIFAIETKAKGVYNIGNTDHNFTKLQLAEMIQERIDCAIAISPGIPDPRNYKVSFYKATKELGFSTIHTPKKAIAQIVDALEQGLLSFSEQNINVAARA